MSPSDIHSLSGLRIIFMGTPDFAVASLKKLVTAGCNIVAVVTAADKPAGRGMKISQSAVKEFALLHQLKILQPVKLKDPVFVEELKAINADIFVVVAFRMLPEIVWTMPPMGTINLHGSLLPDYRGAAPINWAIINGEKVTGITTFKLKHEIDTGNILLSKEIPIGNDETAGELHDRMKDIGADLLLNTVEGIRTGSLTETEQSANGATDLKHAPKIITEICRINWVDSAADIHNLIRGLSPYPAAFTQLDGKMLKIYKSVKEILTPAIQPGEYETDHKTFLKFACTDGYIKVTEIQMEGKKRIMIEDFLRGWRK